MCGHARPDRPATSGRRLHHGRTASIYLPHTTAGVLNSPESLRWSTKWNRGRRHQRRSRLPEQREADAPPPIDTCGAIEFRPPVRGKIEARTRCRDWAGWPGATPSSSAWPAGVATGHGRHAQPRPREHAPVPVRHRAAHLLTRQAESIGSGMKVRTDPGCRHPNVDPLHA